MNQTIHATENHAGKSDQSNIERSLAYFFADHVTRLRFEDLSLEALTWARMGILDTVGVTLAGSHEPCAVLISKALGLMASAPGVAQPNPSARASAHPDVGADVQTPVQLPVFGGITGRAAHWMRRISMEPQPMHSTLMIATTPWAGTPRRPSCPHFLHWQKCIP